MILECSMFIWQFYIIYLLSISIMLYRLVYSAGAMFWIYPSLLKWFNASPKHIAYVREVCICNWILSLALQLFENISIAWFSQTVVEQMQKQYGDIIWKVLKLVFSLAGMNFLRVYTYSSWIITSFHWMPKRRYIRCYAGPSKSWIWTNCSSAYFQWRF